MKHKHHLPSKHQIGDNIKVSFFGESFFHAKIAGVHFIGSNTIKYDLDIQTASGMKRIVNIDEEFIK